MNYFSPEMKEADVNRISMLGLAHIGDGVYELLTRTMLCLQESTGTGPGDGEDPPVFDRGRTGPL